MPVPAHDIITDACQSPSLSGLRRWVYWLLDAIQNDAGGSEVLDPMWPGEAIDLYINMAYTELQQRNIQSFEGANLTKWETPVNEGTSQVAIPGDVFKVDRVLVLAGGDWYPLEYTAPHREPEYAAAGNNWLVVPRYRFQGLNTLLFNPPFSTASTLRVRYYRLPKCLVGDRARTDESFLITWHHLLALEAAIIAKSKSEDDPTDLMRIRDRHYETFINALDQKSAAPVFVQPYYPGGFGA